MGDISGIQGARNALFSNYGTYPPNSPYFGRVIQEAITFQQNNQWLNNEYYGVWRFMPYEMGNHFNFATWQAAPYNQDAGSSYDGDPGGPPDPPPTRVAGNDLDEDTATLENSIGQWTVVLAP